MRRIKEYKELSDRQKRRRINEERSIDLDVDEIVMTDDEIVMTDDENDTYPENEQEAVQIEIDVENYNVDVETEPSEDDDIVSAVSNVLASETSDSEVYMTESEINESEDENDEREKFLINLHNFCLTNLPDEKTKELLNILQNNTKYEGIPRTSEQLFGAIKDTPTPVEISGGKYLHLGIRENLLFLSSRKVPEKIVIDISWDGVRLHKSSKQTMWPIVMRPINVDEGDVMLVGLFVGKKKDLNVHEFFFCLLQELNEIFCNNCIVEVGPSKVQAILEVRCWIADTPAKSFALGKHDVFLFISFDLICSLFRKILSVLLSVCPSVRTAIKNKIHKKFRNFFALHTLDAHCSFSRR